MGSGNSNRKKSDAPFIRRPKQIPSLSSIGIGLSGHGSAFGGSAFGGAAEVCIPSFDVKVKENYLTKAKVKVQLQKKDDRYSVMIGGMEIGSLSVRHSKMISTCMKLGVRYAGEIVLKKQKPYARFDRISG
jgi:hypothetical protein